MNSEIDIVTRLRQFVKGCNHDWNLGNEWYPAPTECVSCIRQRDAADEIERLQEKSDWLESHVGALVIGFRENKKEIERLRKVGDKLAMHLDAFFGMLEPASNEIAEVLKEWKDVRYG